MWFIKKVIKSKRIDNISLNTCKPFLEIPNVKEITDGFALLLGSPSYFRNTNTKY